MRRANQFNFQLCAHLQILPSSFFATKICYPTLSWHRPISVDLHSIILFWKGWGKKLLTFPLLWNMHHLTWPSWCDHQTLNKKGNETGYKLQNQKTMIRGGHTYIQHDSLAQGFSTGSPWAKSGPLTFLGWSFVNFEIHRNTQGNGVHMALIYESLNRLWPFMGQRRN